jgi:hypothetical protein
VYFTSIPFQSCAYTSQTADMIVPGTCESALSGQRWTVLGASHSRNRARLCRRDFFPDGHDNHCEQDRRGHIRRHAAGDVISSGATCHSALFLSSSAHTPVVLLITAQHLKCYIRNLFLCTVTHLQRVSECHLHTCYRIPRLWLFPHACEMRGTDYRSVD